MKITFLGTGNGAGVPVYGCTCPICEQASRQFQLRRQPCSLLLEHDGWRTLIDAGISDLAQYLPAGMTKHILLSHYHMDHVSGLFSLRWGKNSAIAVIGPDDPHGCDDLFKHPGILDFSFKAKPFTTFMLGKVEITPLPLRHSKLTVGYFFRVGSRSFSYLADTAGLPPSTETFLKNNPPTVMIIDCEMPPQRSLPRNHNDVTTVLKFHHAIHPGQTILTHVSHQLDNWLQENDLPENMTTAFDSMTLDLT